MIIKMSGGEKIWDHILTGCCPKPE